MSHKRKLGNPLSYLEQWISFSYYYLPITYAYNAGMFWLWSHVMTPVVPRCPMVVTWSCDGTCSNMWVPLLLPVEWMALTTCSMKGSGATVGVLYPWYRGTPVTTRPRNLTRDTPELPGATPGYFQYQDYRYLDNQYLQKYPCLGTSHPSVKRHRLAEPTPRALAAK
jgi:hypothetical protein